jgi:mannose-6-phosphate isomerase-like protein (cupin superfamily)
LSGYEVVDVAELESFPGPGTLRWSPLRRPLGITAFGTNVYTAAEVGQDVVEEHTEEQLGHEEMYVVLKGRATFELDGKELDVPAGSLVYLRDPKVKRYARAAEPNTTVLAVGGKPGQHDISAWESYFIAYAVVDEDPERAVAEMEAAVAERPDNGALHYHLACIYARTGRLDDARTSLDRAIELRPEVRERAAEDEDLAPLGISRKS